MVSCSVHGCPNQDQFIRKGFKLFRFPLKNKDLLQKWVDACLRSDSVNLFFARVCSDHFSEADYYIHERYDRGAIRNQCIKRILTLLPTAVPSLNLPDSSVAPQKECAVQGCVQSSSPVKHFSFPEEEDIREKWIQQCGMSEDTDVTSATVCEKHFSRKQIVIKLGYESRNCHVPRKVRKLKKNAVPDINLPAGVSGAAAQEAPQESFKTIQHPWELDASEAVHETEVAKGSKGARQKSLEEDTSETVDDMEVTEGAAQESSEEDTSDTMDALEAAEEQAPEQIQEYKDLQEEREHLEEELVVMDQKLMMATLTSVSLDERKTRLYTGLPSLAAFTWLIELVHGCLDSFPQISKSNQLLITLMKLRLGLDTKDLAFRFGIPTNVVWNILSDAIPKMASKLDFLIGWPIRIRLRNVARPFKSRYKNCSVIIDCVEFPIEKPLNRTAESQSWSDIKHQNTVKCLIGITPYGASCFVSQCWGGRVSDRDIVLQSGFLDFLLCGDQVITCKNLFIEKEVSEKGAKIILPKIVHLHEKRSNDHELLAVSHFIRKAFKQIKNYKILAQTLPLPVLPYVDEMITCCLALSNLQPKFR